MNDPQYASLLYERRDGVALLTFNRPERMNAIGGTLKQDIAAAIAHADDDVEVRVIVLTGAGAAFCAGGDVKEMAEQLASGGRPLEEKIRPARDAMLLAIHEARKPVIAAINGAAAGAGMNMALAADIRIASSTARFSQAFIKRGLSLDSGATYFLPRVVGLSKACELAFTGDTLDAQEALRLGIVSRVVATEDLMATAHELAVRIAAGPPVAIRLAKQAIYRGQHGDLRDALGREAAALNVCMDTEDAVEGMASFREKRPPNFMGR
jgi:2-(1,2-epoxy-1,2-dihydrophenyl)acetyl-CoA isomerase